MTQNTNKKVIATYKGKRLSSLRSTENSFHVFHLQERGNSYKTFKVSIDNSIFTDLNLEQNKDYELNWSQPSTQNWDKTTFKKDDNIVIVAPSEDLDPKPQKPTNSEVKDNACYHCKKNICKETDQKVTWYEIDWRQNGVKNDRWCQDCLPELRKWCENGTRDKVFGSEHSGGDCAKVYKNEGNIQTRGGNKVLFPIPRQYNPVWICPWCEKEFKHTESATTVLEHYEHFHNGIHKEKEQNEQDQDHHDKDNPKEDNSPKPNSSILSDDKFSNLYRSKKISKLSYDENKGELYIKYEDNRTETKKETDLDNDNDELKQEIKNLIDYLKQKGKKDKNERYINKEDLNKEKEQQTKKEETNWIPWIVGGALLFTVFLISVLAMVSMSKNKSN